MIFRTALMTTMLLAVALGALLAVAPNSGPASAQSGSTIGLIGADAIIEGNTAAAIGPRDPCVRTEVGSQVTVDFIVDQIPADRPMLGFQMNVEYNPQLLEVVQANSDMLLGAVGQYQPFPGLSDPLPDTDGSYLVSIADLASNNPQGANMESGKGVLTRVTFNAKAPGRSDVQPGYDGDQVYPAIIDPQNTTIQVDSVAKAVVAIGEDCGSVAPAEQVKPLPPIATTTPAAAAQGTSTPAPGSPTPEGQTAEPTPPGTATATPGPSTPATPTPAVLPTAGGGGTDTGMIILAALLGTLGAGLAGAGGFVLYRRARPI